MICKYPLFTFSFIAFFYLTCGLLKPAFVFAQGPILQEVIYYSEDEALKALYPDANRFEPAHISLSTANHQQAEQALRVHFKPQPISLFYVYAQDHFLGTVYELNELGKHYPITFMVALTPQQHIHRIIVRIYREPWGDEVRKKRFLKQFKGKSKTQNFIVDQDIDGVTGATLSAWAIAQGVKKTLILDTLIDHGQKKKN